MLQLSIPEKLQQWGFTFYEKEIEIDEDLAADRLKNAAATKKLAIFDAFEILNRIENEKNIMQDTPTKEKESFGGFAEKRSR